MDLIGNSGSRTTPDSSLIRVMGASAVISRVKIQGNSNFNVRKPSTLRPFGTISLQFLTLLLTLPLPKRLAYMQVGQAQISNLTEFVGKGMQTTLSFGLVQDR